MREFIRQLTDNFFRRARISKPAANTDGQPRAGAEIRIASRVEPSNTSKCTDNLGFPVLVRPLLLLRAAIVPKPVSFLQPPLAILPRV